MNWRCAASSAALLALAAATARPAETAGPLLRAPYIVDATSESVRVCWRGQSRDDLCQKIAGVEAGAAFHYQLPGIQGDWQARTLPPRYDPARFVVFGDAGDGSPAQRRVAEKVAASDPQFVLMTGDIVYPDGTAAQYEENYFGVYRGLLSAVCFFPTPGNHDYGNAWFASTAQARFRDGYAAVFRRPKYYSFDAGPVHFAAIDTNAAYGIPGAEPIDEGAAQGAWLDKDLADTQQPFKVVFMHVPLYSTSGRRHGDNALLRKTLQPLFERHQVALVLAGHEHLYQRSKTINGVTYVTVGTGGAKLQRSHGPADWLAREVVAHGLLAVDAALTGLDIVFFDESGKPRDRFTIPRPLPPSKP